MQKGKTIEWTGKMVDRKQGRRNRKVEVQTYRNVEGGKVDRKKSQEE